MGKTGAFFSSFTSAFLFSHLLFQVYISSPVDVRFALKKKKKRGHSHLQPAHTRPAHLGGKRMSCIPACSRCSFKINPGKHQILLIRPEAAKDSTRLSLWASALFGHWSGIWLYFSTKIFSESSVFHRDLSVFTRPLLSCVYDKLTLIPETQRIFVCQPCFSDRGLFIFGALSCQSHMSLHIILKRLWLECWWRRWRREMRTTLPPTVVRLRPGKAQQDQVPPSTLLKCWKRLLVRLVLNSWWLKHCKYWNHNDFSCL